MEGLGLPVTLVVKAPNQKVADHTVECDHDWTIKKLKEHLSQVYPSQPKEHQQKIIYSGKLLQDHVQLKDVLRKDVEVNAHTVHLVCAHSTSHESSHFSKPAETYKTHSASPSSSQRGSPVVTPPPTPTLPADGVRYRGSAPDVPTTQQQDNFQQQFGANPHTYPGMYHNNMMQYSPEQMMWMQQMYAQHMYAQQYMQMYQQAGMPTPPTSPLPQQAVNQPAAANQPAAGAGNRPANQRMNAGAAGAMFDEDEDEEEVNRDWLDWVYVMSRFGILLAIIYFYSTFGRFVFVLAFFVFMYMYQAGWFRIRRRQVRQETPPPQPQQEQQQNPAAENATPENQPAEGEGQGDPSGTDEPQPAVAEPGPGAILVAWNFVTSFFTSLVPQPPPPVNIN